jgi:hypothetical protein
MTRLLDLAHKAHLVDKLVNDCDGNFGRARLAYFAETSWYQKSLFTERRARPLRSQLHIGKDQDLSYTKLTTPATAKTVAPLASFRPLNTVKRV